MRVLCHAVTSLFVFALFASSSVQAKPGEAPVVVVTTVPADAAVWFDGVKTSQTGTQRRFESPPIPAGRTFTYQIRVAGPAGQGLDETRSVRVHAGDQITLDFTGAQVRETRGRILASRASATTPYWAPAYSYRGSWSAPRASTLADQSPYQGYSWSPWGDRSWSDRSTSPFSR
jgi:uncharacterized protein (TIGR03000 family)